jgi:hypothetical protein
MKIKTIPMSELFHQSDDIYTDIVVSARRAKQIIDSQSIDLESMEEVEDSIELEVIPDEDFDVEKPIVKAVNELMGGELEWYESENDESTED